MRWVWEKLSKWSHCCCQSLESQTWLWLLRSLLFSGETRSRNMHPRSRCWFFTVPTVPRAWRSLWVMMSSLPLVSASLLCYVLWNWLPTRLLELTFGFKHCCCCDHRLHYRIWLPKTKVRIQTSGNDSQGRLAAPSHPLAQSHPGRSPQHQGTILQHCQVGCKSYHRVIVSRWRVCGLSRSKLTSKLLFYHWNSSNSSLTENGPCPVLRCKTVSESCIRWFALCRQIHLGKIYVLCFNF